MKPGPQFRKVRSIASVLVLTWLAAIACAPSRSIQKARFSTVTPADSLNGHKMILVSAGEYLVGAAEHLANPRRRVKLPAYRIADAETTNAQFARFVEATGYVTDAERVGFGMVCREGMLDWEWEQVKGACWRSPQGPGHPGAADLPSHPVTQISGSDAEAYCRWRGCRLPSLEEWEVAARAGRDTRFPWGDELEPKKANVWNGESHRKNTLVDGFMYTAPVRSFLPNAWGLHDVIGNVFEYCTGFSTQYEGRETSELISARGGSWWCSQGTCNYFNLVDIGAMDRRGSLSNQGFRLVLSTQPRSVKRELLPAITSCLDQPAGTGFACAEPSLNNTKWQGGRTAGRTIQRLCGALFPADRTPVNSRLATSRSSR